MRVTIVDYAVGNTKSILLSLKAIGVSALLSRQADEIVKSDFIILPGVGHAGQALTTLRDLELVAPLEEAIFRRGARTLGICLGMQIMVEYLEEGNCAGLGWVRGRAGRLQVDDWRKFKVPHIGWNSVTSTASSRLHPLSERHPSYYFCHAYGVTGLSEASQVATFDYERPRVAAFEVGNLFGVQFHPEKSHDAGRAFLRRFLEI